MTRVRNPTEANLMYVASEIERMGEKLGISREIQKFATDLYIQALKNGYHPKSVDRASATCLFAAAKIREEPIKIHNVADVSRRESGHIYQETSTLSDATGIPLEPDLPSDYVEKYADKLGWEQEPKERAKELCESAEDANLHIGHSPSGIAASVLYALSEIDDLGFTQSEIANVTGITDVTIRDNYTKIMAQSPDVDRKELASRDFECAFELLDDELDLPPDVCDRAKDRAKSVDKDEITRGSSHAGIAAAAYLQTASDEDFDVNIDQVAAAVGVSSDTVKQYKVVV